MDIQAYQEANNNNGQFKAYSDDTLGEVYIIHLHSPLGHARHYVGFSKKVEKRLYYHRTNQGSHFLRVANERGIEYTLAVRFAGTKHDERRLKNISHIKAYCPFCSESPRIFKANVLPHERTYTFCEL